MAKTAAFGTRLMFRDPVTLATTRIHNIADTSGPDISVNAIDATNHDSLDGFAEYLPGQAEAGEMSFDLMFDSADAGFLRAWSLAVDTPAAGGRKVATFYLLLPGLASVISSGLTGVVAGTGWTAGATWVYSSANPGASNTITKALPTSALLAGETYLLEVGFTGAATGTGLINVKIGTTVIGALEPSAGGVQRVVFDHSFGSTVSIVLEVPSTIETAFGFVINKFSLTGIADNSLRRVEFAGSVTKVGWKAAQGDALKASIAIKGTGKPIFIGPTAPQ